MKYGFKLALCFFGGLALGHFVLFPAYAAWGLIPLLLIALPLAVIWTLAAGAITEAIWAAAANE